MPTKYGVGLSQYEQHRYQGTPNESRGSRDFTRATSGFKTDPPSTRSKGDPSQSHDETLLREEVDLTEQNNRGHTHNV